MNKETLQIGAEVYVIPLGPTSTKGIRTEEVLQFVKKDKISRVGDKYFKML